jgi:hypothetical protein
VRVLSPERNIQMDVAKHLAQWQEQSPEQWVRAANRYLPTAITFILVVVIAYELSRLTWAMVPGAVPTAAPPAGRAANSAPVAGASSNYDTLAAAHLFGEAPKEGLRPVVVQEVRRRARHDAGPDLERDPGERSPDRRPGDRVSQSWP